MISLAGACIALAVFFETRGEPDLGKYYVGHIVMNWSQDEDVTPCEVIMNKVHKEHFSFSLGKRSISDLEKRVARITKKSDIEKAAWEKAVVIGQKISKRKFDITGGAKYFNHKRKGVRFKTKLRPVGIGEQLYY